MIIDSLENAQRYAHIHKGFSAAFNYLLTTDLAAAPLGKYHINGDDVFAIVQEYDTQAAADSQMESHKKYIDVQYIIDGEELMGHSILNNHVPSKEYDAEKDFMLFGDTPYFFSKIEAGMFMIFFPTDLHMPGIKVEEPARVKKVVVKVSVGS